MKSTNGLIFNLQLCVVVAFLAFAAIGCNRSLSMTPDGAGGLVPQATDIILAGLADDDPQIRANAIEVVAATKRKELMPTVQQLLKDDFVPVRFAAALAVGDMKYHPAGKMVKRLLNAPDENTRIAAAYAMSRLGSAKYFGIVRKAVKSKDQTVRANAVVLLGKSGDKSDLKLLHRVLRAEDSDGKVRFQTVEALAKLGDEEVFPKLWALVLSSYADDRIIGIKAMGALSSPKAKDVLITKLDDEILEVRLAAAEQLGMLGDTTGEPEVLDVFRKNLTAGMDKTDSERVNVLTALAIGQIGTPSLTKFLPQLLENESKTVRIAAAKAVFQCAMRQ